MPKTRVPRIQPEWAAYHRRRAIELLNEPEVLTSNWLRILSVPDELLFLQPKGSIERERLLRAIDLFPYPNVPHADGLVTFANPEDCEDWMAHEGRFVVRHRISYTDFSENGWPELHIDSRVANNTIVNLMRQAWNDHCRKEGFYSHTFSNSTGQIVDESKIDIAKRVPWGRQGARRNSMLRNIARRKLWEYGVSAQPSLFPFPHYRLKGRVLFSEVNGTAKGAIIDNARVQHRLRRSICSGWRNKAWHGRLMAFMELLAGESPYLMLQVGANEHILVDAMPIQVTSPVSARQINKLGEDGEETDASTIAGPIEQLDDEIDGEMRA